MADSSSAGAGATSSRSSTTDSATTGELIGRAGEQLSSLVQGEMELARAELQVTVKRAVTGASLFGTAGVLALYGGGALVATAILALALLMPPWLAAAIVTVVLFAAAGIAAVVGKKQVEQAPEPVRTSVSNVQSDVETVKRKAQ